MIKMYSTKLLEEENQNFTENSINNTINSKNNIKFINDLKSESISQILFSQIKSQIFGYDYEEIEAIAKYLLQRTKHRPKIGVICGSGLGGLADMSVLLNRDEFKYKDIPNFPISSVAGHKGCFVFGVLQGVEIVLMNGRLHPYEGFPLAKCAMPVRVMKLLGIKTMIVTNAAGALHKEYNVGDIMIIKDHINIPALAGQGSLRGFNDERWGPRFPAMNNAYDREFRQISQQVFEELKLTSIMREGVYVMVAGPQYETVAEVNFIKYKGDAIGMSTAHEVTFARHCGIKVVGFSLITNIAVTEYDTEKEASHKEVLEMAKKRAKDFQNIVTKLIEKLPKD